MKYIAILMPLLIILAACSGASSSSLRDNCSSGGEICVELQAKEPILWDKPITIIITVTSQKDISGLGIYLITEPNRIVVQEPINEEQAKIVKKDRSWINWLVDIKENQTIKLTRKLDLSPEVGEFWIQVQVGTSSIFITDEIRIYMTEEGGKVYLSGTSIPYTEGPMPTMNPDELATALSLPTYTIYPTITPIPVTEALPLEILGGTAYPGPGTPYP